MQRVPINRFFTDQPTFMNGRAALSAKARYDFSRLRTTTSGCPIFIMWIRQVTSLYIGLLHLYHANSLGYQPLRRVPPSLYIGFHRGADSCVNVPIVSMTFWCDGAKRALLFIFIVSI